MIYDIITQIVSDTYDKYGKNTLFREYDYTTNIYKKRIFLYRVQSAINLPYLYEIQLHFFDKITKETNRYSQFVKSCIYCNKKSCYCRMNCCGKYIHLDCGIKHNFACCHLHNNLFIQIPTDCCVCLEKCTTETECHHSLCSTCLIEISKQKQIVTCPMCREVLIDQYKNENENEKMEEFVRLQLNGTETIVRVSYV